MISCLFVWLHLQNNRFFTICGAFLFALTITIHYATTKADFCHKFTESFFNENSRNLRMLFKYKLLTFEIQKVNGEDFGYFKLNEKKLESAPIAKKEKEEAAKETQEKTTTASHTITCPSVTRETASPK